MANLVKTTFKGSGEFKMILFNNIISYQHIHIYICITSSLGNQNLTKLIFRLSMHALGLNIWQIQKFLEFWTLISSLGKLTVRFNYFSLEIVKYLFYKLEKIQNKLWKLQNSTRSKWILQNLRFLRESNIISFYY